MLNVHVTVDTSSWGVLLVSNPVCLIQFTMLNVYVVADVSSWGVLLVMMIDREKNFPKFLFKITRNGLEKYSDSTIVRVCVQKYVIKIHDS